MPDPVTPSDLLGQNVALLGFILLRGLLCRGREVDILELFELSVRH